MVINENKLFDKWKSIIGDQYVKVSSELVEKMMMDVGHFDKRKVLAIISPSCAKEVEQLIQVMSELDLSIPMYPISTGRNWGQGSRKPTGESECILIDLHRMNRILEINLQYGYAIIEPGVTQWQISQALKDTPFSMNVTGSCKDTSIIGNTIDRGLGFNRLREDDLLAFEVVLGNGKRIKTGHFSQIPSAAIDWDVPYYAGPDMTSLFFQSNLGIITAAIIKLIPRHESTKMISGKISKTNLTNAIDLLVKLKHEGLFNSILKVYSESAMKTYRISSESEEETYGFYGSYSGRTTVVKAIEELLIEELSAQKIENIKALDTSNITEDENIILNWYLGNPDPCDSIHSAFGINHCNVDKDAKEGWLFFLPDIPASGKDVEKALDILKRTSEDYSLLINSTINIISDTSIRLVISIRFPRNEKGVLRGRNALEQLYEQFSAHDYYPSRYDIDHRDGKAIFGEGDYLNTLMAIKKVFDEKGIIAPKHYIP
ncbi:hypothetical protein CN395_27930 [Priestia megaterium]|uniref:FAD-binding oxidoreductase n=1 Tax=Priestia megaterium TaxID=1404 RepID=UPI000BF76631|nr:FAD-binding oxidoreductase [Priestia megaterium]PEU52189.1 hypothetical protein CN395_27930 [Priestia megaterium]